MARRARCLVRRIGCRPGELRRARNHGRLKVADQAGHTADIIWWNSGTEPLPIGVFDLALTLDRDNYRRTEAVQCLWVAARQQDADAKIIERQILDLRSESVPFAQLKTSDAIFFTVDPLSDVKRVALHQSPDESATLITIRTAARGSSSRNSSHDSSNSKNSNLKD